MAKTLINMSEEDKEFFIDELVAYSSHLGEPQRDREIVKEFFELFKVPWEYYNKKKLYDIIIITDHAKESEKAGLKIIFGSSMYKD